MTWDDVVVCSLEAWDEVWRRHQYLVVELLAADPHLRVLFVEPPLDTWPRHPSGIGGWLRRGAWTPSPPRPVPGVDRLWRLGPVKALPRAVGPGADLLLRRQVRAGVRRLGMRRPVLWLNDVGFVGLVAASRSGRRTRRGWPGLYDVTDDWLAEPGLAPRIRRRRRRADARALAECAEVVVCSPGLAASRGRTRPVRLVANGVDLELMRTPQERPDDLGPGPVAVYVGTVHESRFDVDLALDLAAALAGASMPGSPGSPGELVLVGPDELSGPARRRLIAAGVRLLGPRPHQRIPAYLQHADVVVVPHLRTPFTESLDPIKAHEALAVGTATVATDVAGFRGLPRPVRVAQREAFVDMVLAALPASRSSPSGDRDTPAPDAPAPDTPAPDAADTPEADVVSWAKRAAQFAAALAAARADR